MINAMNWWKTTVKDYDAVDKRLDMVPVMVRHKQLSDTLADWHGDLGNTDVSLHKFKHLSVEEAQQTAKDLDNAVNWWQQSGKDINVDKAMYDQDNFNKAKKLAQFFKNYDMTQEDRELVADEVDDLLRWFRDQGKKFDLDKCDEDEAEQSSFMFYALLYQIALVATTTILMIPNSRNLILSYPRRVAKLQRLERRSWRTLITR
jgi:hypothetical protein